VIFERYHSGYACLCDNPKPRALILFLKATAILNRWAYYQKISSQFALQKDTMILHNVTKSCQLATFWLTWYELWEITFWRLAIDLKHEYIDTSDLALDAICHNCYLCNIFLLFYGQFKQKLPIGNFLFYFYCFAVNFPTLM